MTTLTIEHLPGSDPPRFRVVDAEGNKTRPVELTSPFAVPIEGAPGKTLMADTGIEFLQVAPLRINHSRGE